MTSTHRSFPCDPAQLTVIRGWAEDVVRQAGFGATAVGEIKLALSEAVTNIMVHSVGTSLADCIDLTIDVDDERVLLIIRDHGECFDLDRYVSPDLDRLAGSGYGVFLMQSVMDGVEFGSHESGNEVRMWKRSAAARDG